MTINLSSELEKSIRAAVDDGRFATVDDAMAAAALLLLRELAGEIPPVGVDPVVGCLRDDAELMDEVVADAYRRRRVEAWRGFDE